MSMLRFSTGIWLRYTVTGTSITARSPSKRPQEGFVATIHHFLSALPLTWLPSLTEFSQYRELREPNRVFSAEPLPCKYLIPQPGFCLWISILSILNLPVRSLPFMFVLAKSRKPQCILLILKNWVFMHLRPLILAFFMYLQGHTGMLAERRMQNASLHRLQES